MLFLVILALSAVGGLIVGSFLTVILARYDSVKSIIKGRSRCPFCDVQISWYDNLPLVSYIFLRGKCRKCSHTISWTYPAIELITAVLFVGVVLIFGNIWTVSDIVTVVFFMSIVSALVVIFIYDIRTMYIPMHVAWWAVGSIAIYIVIQELFLQAPFYNSLLSLTVGAAIGFGFLWTLSAVSQQRWMGSGDAYVGLIGGALAGFPGVILFLTLSFALGAIVGIVLILTGLKTRKDHVPFGPFLALSIGVIIFMLYGLSPISMLELYY